MKHIKQEAINTGTVVNLGFSAVAAGSVNAAATAILSPLPSCCINRSVTEKEDWPGMKEGHVVFST